MDMCENEWTIECSDDEKYEVESKEEWSLEPGDVLLMIDSLNCNNYCVELEWKSPGRRDQSPEPLNNHQPSHHLPQFSDVLQPAEKDNFDFMDEMSSPRLPVRRIGDAVPKGSAKKKTASFNGVLSTMLRHRRLEQQEINLGSKKTDSNTAT
ncbi:uncharacterized protein Pa1 [Fopius arisanus]|uniref:PA1_0 protein n=1 Tax=Fopius arisanus TaxID=64838 RepID=A0A0C9R6G3_9HYME|nr:PREDICTED: uncharacterized protein LOC105268478 [Fopius arisanus]XP_011306372.1 PREDICTED: uncharacterized protein LOC105268478 [Fopius arisanus]XP_011306373.1 PREDICTED: uncharacterized protein LOC105268478 [Fopius arisanus]